MRLNCKFTVRNIMDEYVVVPVGESALKVSGLLTTNEVGAFVLDALREEISGEQLLEKVLAEFDVDAQTAEQDLKELLQTLDKLALLDH